MTTKMGKDMGLPCSYIIERWFLAVEDREEAQQVRVWMAYRRYLEDTVDRF